MKKRIKKLIKYIFIICILFLTTVSAVHSYEVKRGSNWIEECNKDICTKSIYLNDINTKNKYGIYKPINEVYKLQSKTTETLQLIGKNSNTNITFRGLNPAGNEMNINSINGFNIDLQQKAKSYKWGYSLKLPNNKFKAKIFIESDNFIKIFNNDIYVDGSIISFKDVLPYGYLYEIIDFNDKTATLEITKNWTKNNIKSNSNIYIDPTVEYNYTVTGAYAYCDIVYQSSPPPDNGPSIGPGTQYYLNKSGDSSLDTSDNNRGDCGYLISESHHIWQFDFFLDENPSIISEINITSELLSNAIGTDIYSYFWNYSNNSWTLLSQDSVWHTGDKTLNLTINSGIEDAINSTTGLFTYAIHSYKISSSSGVYPDLVKLDVTYGNPNSGNVSELISTTDVIENKFLGKRTLSELVLFSESVTRTIGFAYVNFTYNITPISPIPFNSSGYSFTITWNTTGQSLDYTYANITYQNGTLINSTTDKEITLNNLSINNYYITLWSNTTSNNISTFKDAWYITDQYDPKYLNTTLTGSPYLVNSALQIFINASDDESSISSVFIDISDPNGVIYGNLTTILTSGLWKKSYVPNVAGTWNINMIYISDNASNLIKIDPNVTFVVTSQSTPSPGGVNPTVTSESEDGNGTFKISPSDIMDLVAKPDAYFSVDVALKSDNQFKSLVRVKIFDPCNLYRNFSSSVNPNSQSYFIIDPFEKEVFTFNFYMPPEYNKTNCGIKLTFEEKQGFTKILTIRVLNSPFVSTIKRFLTIIYYPIKFVKDGDSVNLLTPDSFAEFPSIVDLTIPFFGSVIIIISFFIIRFLLYRFIKDLRLDENRKTLTLIAMGISILPFIIMFFPFTITWVTSSKVIGIFFIIATMGIVWSLFVIPKPKYG